MDQFALGRGKLKKIAKALLIKAAFVKNAAFQLKIALLVFCMGLILQMPAISAQEENLQSVDQVTQQEGIEPVTVPVWVFDDTPAIVGQMDGGTTAWAIIRMILVLALCAAAIYGIVFFIRKAQKRAAQSDPYPFLKVLANTHLGFNRYVHLVAVGSKVWLVGAAENGVNLISEIEDKETVDAMLLDDSRKVENPSTRFGDFMSLLRRMGVKASSQTPGADAIRERRERLRGL